MYLLNCQKCGKDIERQHRVKTGVCYECRRDAGRERSRLRYSMMAEEYKIRTFDKAIQSIEFWQKKEQGLKQERVQKEIFIKKLGGAVENGKVIYPKYYSPKSKRRPKKTKAA